MDQNVELRYATGTGYEAVEIPYDGDELSMMIVLPEAGKLGEVEGRLTSEEVEALASRLHTSQVHLRLPKLRYEADSFSLAKVLQQLGMRLPFTSAADFSGITRDEPLRILDVFHKAFLAVDESGTEAAAATAVIIGKVSAPEERHDVFVDRPFVLFIRDGATGAILFLGRIVQLP
jgi:serpin B